MDEDCPCLDAANLLADNPSLKAKLPELFDAAWPRARSDALEETGLLDLPQAPPFTVEQTLGDQDEYVI